MPHMFDPGCFAEPFRTLCANYPEADVYVPDQFRVEWGPDLPPRPVGWFSPRAGDRSRSSTARDHCAPRTGGRGRQTPSGTAAKLGITQSYVIINTYLYSVYGSVKAATKKMRGWRHTVIAGWTHC